MLRKLTAGEQRNTVRQHRCQNARCGGMFNIHLTANLLRNLPVTKNCKSVKILRNYGHECVVAPFLAHPVYRSVAEWLACWTQAQKGPGSNRSRDAVG